MFMGLLNEIVIQMYKSTEPDLKTWGKNYNNIAADVETMFL